MNQLANGTEFILTGGSPFPLLWSRSSGISINSPSPYLTVMMRVPTNLLSSLIKNHFKTWEFIIGILMEGAAKQLDNDIHIVTDLMILMIPSSNWLRNVVISQHRAGILRENVLLTFSFQLRICLVEWKIFDRLIYFYWKDWYGCPS